MTEIEELHQDIGTMEAERQAHLEKSELLLKLSAEQETMRGQEAYIRARIVQTCMAGGLEREIAKLKRRVVDLEASEIRIAAVFLTEEQMAAVDDVADFAAGVAV